VDFSDGEGSATFALAQKAIPPLLLAFSLPTQNSEEPKKSKNSKFFDFLQQHPHTSQHTTCSPNKAKKA
jgi:hypothetical protein